MVRERHSVSGEPLIAGAQASYRKPALDFFVSHPESTLEKNERLEQLRFLENGIAIYVGETPYDSVGVDTEEDLERAAEILRQR